MLCYVILCYVMLCCVVLCCVVLCCVVLCCVVLCCVVLCCVVLCCVVLCCVVLYCIVLHCIALHCIALHCIALHCIALYCIVLYKSVLASGTGRHKESSMSEDRTGLGRFLLLLRPPGPDVPPPLGAHSDQISLVFRVPEELRHVERPEAAPPHPQERQAIPVQGLPEGVHPVLQPLPSQEDAR